MDKPCLRGRFWIATGLAMAVALLTPAAVEIGTNDFRLSDMGAIDGNSSFGAFDPAVAYNGTNDEYLVVWWGDDDTGSLIDGEFEIFGQRINAATGAQIGSDFRISDMGPDGDANFDAFVPAVAYNGTANEYLVVWRGDDNTSPLVDSEFEIFGQRINASTGTPVGVNDFRISFMGPNGNTSYFASDPAVAYNAVSDEYLVVWHGSDSSLAVSEFEIYGQRLAGPTGLAAGGRFRISSTGPDNNAAYDALLPAVTHNGFQNEYLVVWHADDDTSPLVDNELEIFGEILSAGGATVKGDFQISTQGPLLDADYDAFGPAVAYDKVRDRYLVVWQGDDDTTTQIDEEFEIFGQLLDSNGNELAPDDFRISTQGPVDQNALYDALSPAVVYNPQGDEYLVVWSGNELYSGGPAFEIYGQRLDPHGAEIGGDDFRLSDMGTNDANVLFDANTPALAHNSTGNEYLAAWSGDDDTGSLVNEEFEIYGQRLRQPKGDLSITKTDGVTSAVPGQAVTYIITVMNAGPDAAVGATVEDDFPATLTGVSWTCSATLGSSCPASGTGGLAETVTLTAGGSVTFTVTATVVASATGTLANTATVKGPAGFFDAVPGNDSATDNDTVLAPEGALSITKTDGVSEAVPGESVTYTIKASNAGPSDASGVIVQDAFSAKLTDVIWSCAASAGSSCESASGTANLDETVTLAALGNVTFTVTANVVPGATGTLTNTASLVAPAGFDDTGGANSATDVDTLKPKGDLAITKTDGQTTAVPGEPLTYVITVTNAGPSDVVGATVTDTFPPGFTGVTWTCSASAGSSCPPSGAGNVSVPVTVLAGGTVVFTATGTVQASATGSLLNTAKVDVPTGFTDPVPGNNTSTDSDVLTPRTDLSIAKTDSPDPVVAGTDLTYTLTVTNHGPSTSTGGTVSDPLPAGVAFKSSSDCTHAAGTVTCAIGALVVGASQAVSYVATVDPGQTAALSNTATVAANETDPASANNTSAAAATTVVAEADLSIAKADSPDPVVAGTDLTYTLTVTNHGPSTSTGGTVSDALPAGVAFQFSADCTHAAGTVTCAVGTLTVGASQVVSYMTTVDPGQIASLSNVATVTGNETDPASANNVSPAAATAVLAVADLAIAKADSPDPVVAGTDLTYTLTVTNHGPSTSTGGTVSDPLPAGVTFQSSGDCAHAGGTVTCAIGALAVGASQAVSFVMTVDPGRVSALSNSATVTGNETDPASANNVSPAASTAVVVEADVAVDKSVSPAGDVTPGTTLVYTLAVSNAGPSTATSVVVTDVLPAGIDLVAADLASGSSLIFADGFESGDVSAWGSSACTESGGTVTCAAGSLAPGASTSFRIEVIVDPLTTGTLENTASVAADGTDPVASNDSDSVSTTVMAGPADVGVKIADAPDPVAVGGTLTYTLTVTNFGPATATGVTLEDFLPAEVSSPAVVSPASGCSVVGNTVTCDLGILAVGGRSVVKVAVTVDPAAFPALTNPASVRADPNDPRPSNDTFTETTSVTP